MKRLSLASSLFALLALTASAQIVVWDVESRDASANDPLAANSSDPNITSASMTLGGGISASSANNTFRGSGFTATSLADAITGNEYISISVLVADGFELNISQVDFNSGVSTPVTNFNGALLLSPTGFASDDSQLSYSFSSSGADSQSVTLSGISALQGVSGSVELRLYGWRNNSGTSTFGVRSLSGDDFEIFGSVTASAVPEPSSFAALAGLAMLGFVGSRRRRAVSTA